MDELVVLYTTWPDAETAEAFGRRAVEERLAACANVLAPMRSIYRWEGRIHCEIETPMLLKTTSGAVERLGDLILRYHPYETPCVVALGHRPLELQPEVRLLGEGRNRLTTISCDLLSRARRVSLTSPQTR